VPEKKSEIYARKTSTGYVWLTFLSSKTYKAPSAALARPQTLMFTYRQHCGGSFAMGRCVCVFLWKRSSREKRWTNFDDIFWLDCWHYTENSSNFSWSYHGSEL